MTAEERLNRIEHITAAIAEERRKDREEYKTLRRDTQRQINEFASGMVGLRQHAAELAVHIQEVDDRLRDRIDQLATESRAADKALSDRISSLVSAMGEFITKK
jgi:hypothetical protein